MSKRLSKIGWIVLVALLSLALVVLPACGGTAEQEEEEEEEGIPLKNPTDFVQQTIGDVDSLDPAWGYDTASGEQVDYIYETLIKYDEEDTLNFVYVLATEVVVVNSTQIKFKIRTGVKFQNGNDLTPSDVEYSFERAIVQDRGGGPTWMFNVPLFGRARITSAGVFKVTAEQIDNAVEVDGDWVVFNFGIEYPMLQWKQILTQSWASILDKEWCVANGEWDGALTGEGWKAFNRPAKQDTFLYNKAMGTGPWKLDLWEPGEYIRLVKSDNYWGTPVFFNKVITQFVDEWTSRKLALLNGDADLVYVPRMYIGELAGIADLQPIKDLPELSVDTLFFNMDIDPNSDLIGSGALDGKGIPPDFFTDEDVRKGFAYAFDYDTFLEDVMLGEGEMMGSPIVAPLSGYDPNAKKYTLDLAKAEQYLKAAWGGDVWELGFKFTMVYNSGNIPRKTACEILAENLFGLNEKFLISILPMTWPSILDNIFTETDVSKGPLPLFQIGWLADYPDADNFATPFMHSTGDFSYYQGYGYAELDAKIETARYMDSGPARDAAYKELSDIYYDDAPGIMLAQPLGRRWFTKYIKGFYFNPTIPGTPGPLEFMSKSAS
jgi:peptide/nickel transport system substrate-binding protein